MAFLVHDSWQCSDHSLHLQNGERCYAIAETDPRLFLYFVEGWSRLDDCGGVSTRFMLASFEDVRTLLRTNGWRDVVVSVIVPKSRIDSDERRHGRIRDVWISLDANGVDITILELSDGRSIHIPSVEALRRPFEEPLCIFRDGHLA